tara:strand:- start:333 stop:695 length:363 start_codon:yes stop_codon:yes gene_type:complete
MGNVSQQSKQKQETLKKGLTMSVGKQVKDVTKDSSVTQIPSARLTRDICLSPGQADLAKKLLEGVNKSHAAHIQAQTGWEAFLIGAGMVQGEQITGGDLDSNDPTKRCLTVQSDNGVSGG